MTSLHIQERSNGTYSIFVDGEHVASAPSLHPAHLPKAFHAIYNAGMEEGYKQAKDELKEWINES